MATPENFGAKGDGKTDDYAAFQKMFDSFGNVSAGQKQVPSVAVLTPGAIYCVSQTPTIRQYNVKVMGNFAALKATGGQPALAVGAAQYVSGVSVEKLYLQGGSHCFYASGAPQLLLSQVFCKDLASDGTAVRCCSADAMHLEGCVSLRIVDCAIDKPGNYGIRVQSTPQAAESQACVVERCRVYRAGNTGISFSEGGGHIARDNDVELCYGGIYAHASFSFYFENNYFEADGTDMLVDNVHQYVPSRAVQCGLIRGNDSNSGNSVILQSGNGIVMSYNRFGGVVYIQPPVTNAVFGRQLMQNGLSNGSSSTIIGG